MQDLQEMQTQDPYYIEGTIIMHGQSTEDYPRQEPLEPKHTVMQQNMGPDLLSPLQPYPMFMIIILHKVTMFLCHITTFKHK